MSRNYIVLDTEGVDTVKHNDGRVYAETSLFYDLGFIVVDGKTHEIIARYSFINSDVFFKSDLMTSAYYAEKLPRYYEGMNSIWTIADTLTIWETFKNACKQFNVKKVWAFNCQYDKKCANNTIKTFSNGFCKYFLPYGVEWCDIWDYAGSTICNTKKYVKWCIEHLFLSEKGNPRTNAETVYRYLIADNSFIEDHTALSDCEIELSILRKAKARKQKARHSKGQGWRDAAKILKNLE